MAHEELVERAARTDLVADTITAMAEELSAEDVDAAFALASDKREIDGATALALIRLAQGRMPDAETVERIYPDAIDERAAQVLLAAHPERRDILTAILGSRRPDRYQLAMACALFLHLHPDEAPPPVLLEVLRTLSRARAGWVGEGWAVQAVLRLDDPDLHQRYAIDPKRDVLDEGMFAGIAPGVGVDALPATRSKVLAAGFTARRAQPKVGRNDPCPCGSGKKYKKCHLGKDDAALSPAAGLTMREYRLRLHELCTAEELMSKHPADLARLPFDKLDVPQATACFRVFLDCERMDEAEAIVKQLGGREEPLGDKVTIEDYKAELVEFAHELGHDELAQRTLASMEDPSLVSNHVRIGRALRNPDADTLSLLEQHARPYFLEGGRPPSSIAYELLDPYPALGVLLTRGCLDPEFEQDSRTLLDEIEWARDRLGAPPNDPYWRVLEGMLVDRKVALATDVEKEALRAELERARAEAEDARAQAHVLARELGQQSEQLGELEARAADAEQRAEAAKADDDTASAEQEAEAARRLRFKIRELQARIREGQEERADLRRRAEELASAQSEDEVSPTAAPTEERGEPAIPHGVRIPTWSDKARSSLDKMPKHVMAQAIATAGALGAGRPEAWRHAKRLEGLHGLCSARLGIHHRLLFRMDEDGVLDVEEVVTREDLDRALAARR